MEFSKIAAQKSRPIEPGKFSGLAKTLFLIIIIFGFSNNLYAQKQQKKDPCDDAQTQVEMNDCAKKEFDRTDAELNKVYNQLMVKLEGEHKSKLKAAELAWLKYRDANCECESFINLGGTIYPLVYNGCLTTMTKARIKEMKEFMKEVEQ